MRRRTFLELLGASAAWTIARPMAATAQQSGVARVGIIMPSFVFTLGRDPMSHFLARMRELGWDAGRNITFDKRPVAAASRDLVTVATDLTREKPDAIVVDTLQTALVVRSVAPRVPIVIVAAGDPVRAGAAKSLARPGGT